MATTAEQRAYLRRSVGHAEDTALISDDLLDDCITSALRELNTHFPLQGVGSFTTVADQQTYTPLGGIVGTTYQVRRVFWPQDSACQYPAELVFELDPFFLAFADSDSEGIRYTYEPAAVESVFRFREYLRRFFGGGASIEPPGTVRLMPPPTTTGDDVYFLYSAPRFATADDVTDYYLEPHYCYAKMCLHESLASGRGAVESVSSPAGVSIRTGARQSHLELAKREQQKFLNLLPPLAPTRHMP